ncbi:MAG: regulatory protein RecX [Clostridia bacterium]|nr:regulatory protein RecX [Clostridia bacterium]
MKKKVGNTPMDAALKYLTHKPRTIREMERHLDSCNYGEFEVYQVVERLKELDYLNDEKYAEEFVRSRLATKPVSRKKLYQQLMTHELPREIIEKALEGVDDSCEQDGAREIAEKFNRQLSDLPEDERRERVMRRLAGRGYDFDTAREAWDSLKNEE